MILSFLGGKAFKYALLGVGAVVVLGVAKMAIADYNATKEELGQVKQANVDLTEGLIESKRNAALLQAENERNEQIIATHAVKVKQIWRNARNDLDEEMRRLEKSSCARIFKMRLCDEYIDGLLGPDPNAGDDSRPAGAGEG